MNVLVIAIFYIFVISVYAECTVTYQNPNTTMSINTDKFKVESKNDIDASENNSHITYINTTPTSRIRKSIENDKVLNEDVVVSDNTSKPIPGDSKSAADNKPSTKLTIVPTIVTTYITSITISSDNSSSSNRTETTKPSTSLQTLVTGEPPPTLSAKLGIGLGITFIGILIIGELMYFKYCYHHRSLRSDSYLPEIVS